MGENILRRTGDDEGVHWESGRQDARVLAMSVGCPEGGQVHVWIKINGERIDELLVYLDPKEAMAFAKAFERCAIEALKASV